MNEKVEGEVKCHTLQLKAALYLIKRLTEVSSEIMNVPQEFFVTTIKELPDKNFGIGDKRSPIKKSPSYNKCRPDNGFAIGYD